MPVVYKIEGRKPLHGKVTAQGLPGAALAGIAAALLTQQIITLRHVPHLPALDRLLVELRELGVAADWTHRHEVTLHATELQPFPLLSTNQLLSRLPLLVAAIVVRCGVCRLELHSSEQGGLMQLMEIMRRFGGLVEVQDGLLKLALPHLHGSRVNASGLDVQTCLAIMVLGAAAEGLTEIENLPADPQIMALSHILTSLGIEVQWQDQYWRATGSNHLNGASIILDSDPMEVGLFGLAALVTGGDVAIQGVAANRVTGFLGKLRELGAGYRVESDTLRFWKEGQEAWPSVIVEGAAYPNIPNSWLPMFLPVLIQANGEAILQPVGIEVRQAVEALRGWGAEFYFGESAVRIFGPIKLSAGTMQIHTQAEGLVGLLAALSAGGVSELVGMEIIEGQFEHLSERLQALGAKIERQER
jgi:UDP-N-acetylglucosamine 1-carboxyvinyltransferase